MVKIYTKDWTLVCSGHTTEEAWANLPCQYVERRNELWVYYL
jgi:hypothetical protein